MTQPNCLNYGSEGDVLSLNLANGLHVRLSFPRSAILRVQCDTQSGTSPPSWAIPEPPGTVSADLAKYAGSLTWRSENLMVEINLSPFTLNVRSETGLTLARDGWLAWERDEISHTTNLSQRVPGSQDQAFQRIGKISWTADLPPGQRCYGFGQKTGPMDKRSRRMTMWNVRCMPILPSSDPLYKSIPFFYGLRDGRAYGFFLDSPARSVFDMGQDNPERYVVNVYSQWMDFFLIDGPAPRDVLQRYTAFTGRMPRPPMWALGHHHSRWGYDSEARIREIAAAFREHDIPCDALYLDIDYMDGFRVFTWDPERFPDPVGMIADLRRDGFRIVASINPGIKVEPSYQVFDDGIARDYFCRDSQGNLFTARLWPGQVAFPDFSRDSVRRWWSEHLWRSFLEMEVAGIWNDMNEPGFLDHKVTGEPMVHNPDDGMELSHTELHNAYGLLVSRATYEAMCRYRPDERPFVLSRSAYAGSQRYGAVWTGDNSSWWEHLADMLQTLLNLSVSGIPLAGADVGGFGDVCTGELLTRWYQAAVFTPFLRNHNITPDRPPTHDQEPWAFGEPYTGYIRHYLKLRYRLLPYLYSAFCKHTIDGSPVMCPLWYEFPGDPDTEAIADQFMCGSALLVAPILQPGCEWRSVYIPEGLWYRYDSEQVVHGRIHLVARAPLEHIPIYVRGGAVIPTIPARDHTGFPSPDTLQLTIYPAPGEHYYRLYEDDGLSFGYERGEWGERDILTHLEGERLLVRIDAQRGEYCPPERTLSVRLWDRRILFEGDDQGQALELVENGVSLPFL